MRIIICVLALLSVGCTGCQLTDSLGKRSLYPFEAVDQKFPVKAPPKGVSEVTLMTNHMPIHAWYKDNKKPATLVYFHGNGENLEAMKGMYPILSALGNWVVMDYPGLGKSKGDPREETLSDAGVTTLKFASKTFPDTKIIVWGRSLGAAVAMQVMKRAEKKPDKLILTSAWTNIKEVNSATKLLSDKFLRDHAYDSLSIAPQIATTTLFHHGTNDELIAYELGEKLSKAFMPTSVKFVPLERGHNDIFQEQKLWNDISVFVK